MNALLDKYIEEYDVERVMILGKNIVNRNVDDKESIDKFLCFLLDLAKSLSVVDEQRFYLDQAKIIISYLSENMDLNENKIEWVFSIQQKADEVENVINEKENSKIVNLVNEIQKENSKGMIEIHEILEKLRIIDEQSAFDECMQKFIKIDRKIQKDYLSDDEQVRYDLLSKRCSETISEQLQKIERQKNIIYNNEAIESYKIAFQEFKKRESVFKNDLPSLMEMLKIRLFAFDANRLLPETIMYYQNIYKSIFDALSDEGKELLTKTSINVINY